VVNFLLLFADLIFDGLYTGRVLTQDEFLLRLKFFIIFGEFFDGLFLSGYYFLEATGLFVQS
jgi:hypothetical protein